MKGIVTIVTVKARGARETWHALASHILMIMSDNEAAQLTPQTEVSRELTREEGTPRKLRHRKLHCYYLGVWL
jgi:hypothetical protein